MGKGDNRKTRKMRRRRAMKRLKERIAAKIRGEK